ncbi:MAG: AAA family ATPase [Planctomycetota bacterium]|nr:AAA family ATPase [Planctomycetota bacterium]
MNPSPDAMPWLDALADPSTYPHPCGTIEVLHTHLSVVALTGTYAYKFKKPVDYGFADFSTLELRKRYCEEELRLNRRTAPEIYLEVASLARGPSGWRVGGDGAAAEFAVKMRQFDPALRLDRVAARGELTEAHIDAIARRVADLHASAEPADAATAASYPERLAGAIRHNFDHLTDTERERGLRTSFEAHLRAHAGLLEARARASCVRDCHGDLHLANICLLDGRPLLFDCIEFNPGLRIIDVLSDAAFLYMDLLERGHVAHAQRFLNAYLETTGDYLGLPAWPLFVAYRAHVRAKIAQLTLGAPGVPEAERARQAQARDTYLNLAEQALAWPRGGIALMAGLPGSGKSTVALRAACAGRGLRIRSDVERKRLHAKHAHLDLYGAEMGRLAYAALLADARAASAAGQEAILDATHVKRSSRASALALARELGVPARILHCDAPMDELRARVRGRQARGGDVSDADERVLELLAGEFEDFSEDERPLVERVP